MTKRCLGGLALCCAAALIVTGCPQPTDNSPGGPSVFGAAPALTLAAGETAGSLVYRWTASDPAADSYDFYYAEGFLTDPARVKAGTRIPGAASGGTLDGLSQGTIYSALLTAYRDGYETADTVIRYRTVPADNTAASYAGFTTAPVLTLAAGIQPGSLTYTITDSNPGAEFYTLYYVEGNVTDPAAIIRGTELPYAVSGGTISVTAGADCSALVRAHKSNFNAGDSAVDTKTTSALPTLIAPLLTMTPGTAVAGGQLIFSATASDPAADNYNVYYIAGTETDPEIIKRDGTSQYMDPAGRSSTRSNLTLGGAYSALVTVTKAGYIDSESAVVHGRASIVRPVLTVTAGTSALDYAWTASDPVAASYDLYYVLGNETNPETVKGGTKIPGASSSGGTISGLADGAVYSVLLSANITDGDGSFSVDSPVGWETIIGPGSQKSKTINGVTLKFNYVPGGSFLRSSSAANVTTITGGYWLGETEVTQELFQAVMGSNPSGFTGDLGDGEDSTKRPVEQVTWYAAIAFCNKLSMADNKTPAYHVAGVSNWSNVTIPTVFDQTWNAATLVPGANGYRLPSSMEWFWAAMGAVKTEQPYTTGYNKAFAGSTGLNSIGDYVWYNANAGGKTHEVGKKDPNELGLRDMSGNVAEWCHDYGGGVPSGALTDYMGPSTLGGRRVYRGGYYSSASLTVSTTPTLAHQSVQNYLGLRVLCPVQP